MRDTTLNYPCSLELGLFDGTDNGTLRELARRKFSTLTFSSRMDVCSIYSLKMTVWYLFRYLLCILLLSYVATMSAIKTSTRRIVRIHEDKSKLISKKVFESAQKEARYLQVVCSDNNLVAVV